jgi:nitrogen fixation protein NifU and related proteins
MDDFAQANILDHSRYPRNQGALDAPTASHELRNPVCGDRVRIDLLIADGTVQDIRFDGRGCAISQAAASMLTETLMGQPLTVAQAFSTDDILDLLGIPIGVARMKCATLGLTALQIALTEIDGGTRVQEAAR